MLPPFFLGNRGRGPDMRTPSIFRIRMKASFPLLSFFLVAATICATSVAQAQTFSVIHNFTGQQDGGVPTTGLGIDAAGNLYGNTSQGGTNCAPYGCGVVFKMANRGGNWLLTQLCSYCMEGTEPSSRPAIAPNGVLYFTTLYGGQHADGALYQVRPPAQPPRSILSPWSYAVIFNFNRGGPGADPQGDLTFDQAGNIYGTTQVGGDNFNGVVYELMPFNGGWSETVLYAPSGGLGALQMNGGVAFDRAGNLYGEIVEGGQNGAGAVFELSPSPSGWTAQTIYSFQGGTDGSSPVGGLLVDAAGNVYGATNTGGSGGGGTVFELTPSGGGWTFNLLYSLSGRTDSGPTDKLAMDPAGNLYGVTYSGGAHTFGSVFKLTPSGGSWIYTTLHDFTGTGFDGAFPRCGPTLDASGNVYGTTSKAGSSNEGIVWQITP